MQNSENESSLGLSRVAQRKYMFFYYKLRQKVVSCYEQWTASIQLIKTRIKKIKIRHTEHFLNQIKKHEGLPLLSAKQYKRILEEIVLIFKFEVARILKEKDSEYLRLSEQNCRLLKESNRNNNNYCIPQKLLKFDIISLFLQKQYEFSHCKGYSIPRLVPNKLIEQITQIPHIPSLYASLKIKWEENYEFIDLSKRSHFFQRLVQIICLVLLKKKLSSTQQSYNFEGQVLRKAKPKNKYCFPHSQKFKYPFCQLAMTNPQDMDIVRKSHSQKFEITRKIKRILQYAQQCDQRKELLLVIMDYRISFRSISEWMKDSPQKIQQLRTKEWKITKEIQQTKWKYLIKTNHNCSNFDVFSRTRNDKDALSRHNFVGQSLCQVSLERYRLFATVMSIQNRIMIEIEKRKPIYIRRFKYIYEQYYKIHRQEVLPTIDEQKNNMKIKENKENVEKVELILGFSQEKNIFALKFNEQLPEAFYAQLLIHFFKTKKRQFISVVFSEFDFARNSLSEATLKRIINRFRSIYDTYVKFEARETYFFHHLLVHCFIDKTLRETKFNTFKEFSQTISHSFLKIVTILNRNEANSSNHVKQEFFDEQKEEVDRHEDLLQESNDKPMNFDQYGQQFTSSFSSFSLEEKMQCIFSKKQWIKSVLSSKNLSWHGKTSFLKKGIQCQFYFKDQQNTKDKIAINPDEGISKSDRLGLKKLVEDLSSALQQIFLRNQPFLSSEQIQQALKNIPDFVKFKHTSLRQIKSLLREIAKILLIYQAYYYEYFQNQAVNPVVWQKYQRELQFLKSVYEDQTQNIRHLFPGKLQLIYKRLLYDLSLYPKTLAMLRQFPFQLNDQAERQSIKVQQKEMQSQQQ